ncbi:MAG: hypothetical protein ACI35V_09100 [Sphingobacterium composti]
MRSIVLFFSISVLSLISAKAQEKKININPKHFSIPKIEFSSTDSLNTFKSKNLDSLLIPIDRSVNMPNAYTESKLVDQMPIKKLNGIGLAPMPGTENLDRLEVKNRMDSLRQRDKDKK